MVSSAEANYIIESCLDDFRIDGRSRSEYRPYSISNNNNNERHRRRSSSSGVVVGTTTPSSSSSSLVLSNGSSRIHLPGSSTEILCSVKADLVRPSSSRPNAGVCELCVDLSLWGGSGAICGQGGGGGGGQRRRRRKIREDESELSSLLTRLVLPHALDYQMLVVWPCRYVWRLCIDVVVMRCDGCVLDACSIAIRAALIDARLPNVVPLIDDGGGVASSASVVAAGGGVGGGGGGVGYGELFPGGGGGGKGDLLVDGDHGRARPPPGAEKCPLIVTVSVLKAPLPPSSSSSSSSSSTTTRRYRSVPIIDARAEEEACASSRVCVSVDPDGVVCGVHTLGGGGAALSEEEEEGGGEDGDGCVGGGGGGGGGSLPLAMLGDVVTSAAMASRRLYALLRNDDGGEKGEEGGEGANRGAGGGTTRKERMGYDTIDDDGGCYGYLLKDHFLIR